MARAKKAEKAKRAQKPTYIKHLIIARHGEPVNHVFGDGAVQRSFRGTRYMPANTNMPDVLPIPHRRLADYRFDSPLTEFGLQLRGRVGRALAPYHIVASYVSPALRCVQTAQEMTPDGPLKIEPGLHEDHYPHWDKDINDAYLTAEQYDRAGFLVDRDYAPRHRQITIDPGRPLIFRRRFGEALDSLIQTEDTAHPGSSVLIVAHSTTHDSALAHLLDGHWETFNANGEYAGAHFTTEPVYGQVTILRRQPDGTWEWASPEENRHYTTRTFTTVPEIADEEDDDEEELD